eukprot:686565-Rhodomonas_salina.1
MLEDASFAFPSGQDETDKAPGLGDKRLPKKNVEKLEHNNVVRNRKGKKIQSSFEIEGECVLVVDKHYSAHKSRVAYNRAIAYQITM